jgi:predicted dehydrogenase
MLEKIRWGIISTGNIANQFAKGLQFLDDAELVAVGSRTQESADAFGEKYNIPHRHPTYEALAADPDIDAVYVATPHPMHYANTLLCLENGKAVLCEKAFAMTGDEAATMARVAREKNLFLMEAMWTRFLPLYVRLRQMLHDEKVLGEIQFMQADFGFAAKFDPKSRLFAPELGGGALLDVGIYVASLASFVFRDQPQTIRSMAHLGETGVDERTSMQFRYANGGMANLFCATRQQTPVEAIIGGEKGYIRLHPRFYVGTKMTLILNGQDAQEIEIPIANNNGYQYEAAEVGRCMRAGKLESDIMPLDETVAIMRTLDRVGEVWNQ